MSFRVPVGIPHRGVKRAAAGGGPKPPKPTRKTTNCAKKDKINKLFVEDSKDSDQLCNEIEKLRSSSDKENRTQICTTIINLATSIIDRKYDLLIKHDCSRDDFEASANSSQLRFIIQCLEEAGKNNPILPAWIRWALSKLLQSLTGRIVFDKMGAEINALTIPLVNLMTKDDATDLLLALIDQMKGMIEGSTTFRLAKPDAPPKYAFEFAIGTLNGGDTAIIHSIVVLMVVHNFDFGAMNARYQLKLWQCLFHLAKKQCVRAQHSAIQMMYRLLHLEMGTTEVVRVVVDYVMALLKIHTPTMPELEAIGKLRDSCITIVKFLTEQLRRLSKHRLLSGLTGAIAARWALRALEQTLAWNTVADTSCSFALESQRMDLLSFAAAICRLLASIPVDAAKTLAAQLCPLEGAVKKVVSILLAKSSSASSSRCVEEMIAAGFGLLLFVDDVQATSDNATWIADTTAGSISSTQSASGSRIAAALRTRQLVISSLTPPTSDSSTNHCGQPKSTSTMTLIEKILPSESQILEYIRSVESMTPEQGAIVLKALIELVAQMLPLPQWKQESAVAVLSLPWLAVEAELQMNAKRHYHSLPLLKELFPLAKIVKRACGESILVGIVHSIGIRVATLAPLSSLQRARFSEWRRAIFGYALKLTPSRSAPSPDSIIIVRAALECLSSFVASVEPAAFEKTLSMLIELIHVDNVENSPVHIEVVLRAIADSLCALVESDNRKRTSDGECEACDRLLSSGVATGRAITLPSSFCQLLVRVFQDASIRGSPIQNRLDAYSVLFALLCHVKDAIVTLEEAIIASLSLITDRDEEVRKEYQCTFKVIISMKPSVEVMKKVQHAFKVDENVCEQTIFEVSAPFLRLCASECPDAVISQWARLELYERALRYPESRTLREHAGQLHVGEAKKVKEIDGDARRFFTRQCRSLSTILSKELLEGVEMLSEDKYHNENAMDGAWDIKPKEIKDAVDSLCDVTLDAAAVIWGFDGVISLLRSCASHIVADCFVVDEANHAHSIMVMDRIRSILNREPRSLVEECLPCIMERLVSNTKSSKSINKAIIKLSKEYAGVSLRDLLDARRFHCSLFVLRTLAINKSKALFLLANINRVPEDSSLTSMLKIRCEYLGHLLSLRRSLMEDDQYELRFEVLRSIEMMITMFDQQFLDEIASKLMMVLRAATPLGEEALPLWTAFVDRLGNEVLVSLLPQILIDIHPLLRFESSTKLLYTIFEQRHALNVDQSDAVLVLLGGSSRATTVEEEDEGSIRIAKYLRKLQIVQKSSCEDVILGCARMLMEEGENVGRVVLQRLESTLDGRPLNDDVAAAIMPALLHAIRVCSDADVRLAASRCIGLVGAVDPGRLGLSLEHKRRGGKGKGEKKFLFVNSPHQEFFIDIIIRAWRLYASLSDADTIDIGSYAIQTLLCKVMGPADPKGVFGRLPDECKRDIGPLRNTSLTNSSELKPIDTDGKPIVDVVNQFSEWLLQNFLMGVNKIKGRELYDIFSALKWLVHIRDTSFARHVLPHVIIIMLQEDTRDMIAQYSREMVEVLKRAISPQSADWTRLAAHVVFSCLDLLERYAIGKSSKRLIGKDLDNARNFIADVCRERHSDGRLLVVVAAEKCQCLLRALRWCEQFAIVPTTDGASFDRSPLYDLERLHMQLNDVDGVAGAFETIARFTSPTADERILALEANGDYTEALPLYALSSENKELKLLECLLRLNQPQLALSTATSSKKSGRDASTARALEAAQLEAAWHLRDWSRLDDLLEKRDPLSTRDMGWGASCASLMSTIQHRDAELLSVKTSRARSNLVERLTALTIEDSDTYAQSYKYITQLHILAEVDDAKDSLGLLSDSPRSAEAIAAVMREWQDRSESAAQCASSIEPMLRVRRELLRATGGDSTKDAVSQLLLHSCRLARQAGHLQIAWTFLVEAKALDTSHSAVGMEEARFEFQKGNQSEAIGLLSRLLNARFSRTHEIFTLFSRPSKKDFSSSLTFQSTTSTSWPPSSSFSPQSPSVLTSEERKMAPAVLVREHTTREERNAYAEVQLLRTEYMLKAGAASPDDLYQTYHALQRFEVPSEDLHYRVAVFYDSLLCMTQIRSALIADIIKSYGKVLEYGRSHLFHAVPRMLTIWLDVTQKLCDDISTANKTGKKTDGELWAREVSELNTAMRRVFDSLPITVFFPAFPQLISRIVHPSPSVFATLQYILSKLFARFPHQCLWQAIAVYRENTKDGNLTERQNRCMQILDNAKREQGANSELSDLIDQYDYVARLFIYIAENKSCTSEERLSKICPALAAFFHDKKMDTRQLVNSQKRKLYGMRNVHPQVMIPMAEMLEQTTTEIEQDVKFSTASQYNLDVSSCPLVHGDAPSGQEVFIHDVDEGVLVLSSMQKPKRLTLRGSDGKSYMILCKNKDELRMDGRFMAFCKMMNCLMRRSPEARRRQLMVRTFSVTPLQPEGGILEWLPDLQPFKKTLNDLFEEMSPRANERVTKQHWQDTWPTERKLESMRTFFYERYPLVAAEWLRRAFPDPYSWHAARQLYSRSCSVMSMIGFVLGLGDRHAENILVDQTDGCMIHVDFNLLFNKGEYLNVPEIVPFRLTRNIVNGFGPTGVEGTFRRAAEITLEVMRTNQETLLTVLQAFVHDPLVEFGKERAQQNKVVQRAPHEKAMDKSVENAQEKLEMIKLRLKGHIVTPKTLKKHTLNAPPMSVKGQVSKLIEIATDETILAQMYSGWSPYM